MWEGCLWFEKGKKEFFGSVGGDSNVIAPGLPLGALMTQFIRLDCTDSNQIKQFLDRFGNPPIFDEAGNKVPDEQISKTLIREQELLNKFIDALLFFEDPDSDKCHDYHKLQPSKRIQFWQHRGFSVREYGSRLIRIGLEPTAVLKENRYRKIGEKPGTFERDGKMHPGTEILFEDRVEANRKRFENRIYRLNQEIRARLRELGEDNEVNSKDKFIVDRIKLRENWEARLKRIEDEEWYPIFSYISGDFLAFMWLEVFHAAEQDGFALKCEGCGKFFLHAKRKDAKFCKWCINPKRLPIAERTPEQQDEQRKAWTDNKQKQRDKKG